MVKRSKNGLTSTSRRRRLARRDELADLMRAVYRVKVPRKKVCHDHHSPMDFLEAWIYDPPDISLVLGPRGGGKSYLAAGATHIDSVCEQIDTMVLGGSESQSAQIYNALKEFRDPPGVQQDVIAQFNSDRAIYHNGSTVTYIPASDKSVRGPHVARLRLDEVDEIDPDIRESAMGMCMAMRGIAPSVSMTSTYHRVNGPMKDLLERGENGDFPVFRFCIFEVLERCPDERSGANLERCPDCPIVKWCHAERDSYGQGIPKAKRSLGHYTIDSLIQKVKAVSTRVFESDYLCTGPRADGIWFTQFDEASNVSTSAEFDPRLPVYISIDSGVWTGAVFLQVRELASGYHVTVFADYLAEGLTAEHAGREILAVVGERCGAAQRFVSTDSAGGARNPVGPPVIAEYERIGLRGRSGIQQWPRYSGSVASGLATLEAVVASADGSVNLKIHPRCRNLIAAFKGYARAKRANQWMDYPEDPQHPHEDLIDALRGQLALLMPEGRKPAPKLGRVHGSKLL